MTRIENVGSFDTLDATKKHTTNKDFLNGHFMERSNEIFANTVENNDDANMRADEVSPKENSISNILIKNAKKFNLLFTKKQMLKTGFFFLSALAVGYGVFKRWRLFNTFQDSILVTSYAANCILINLTLSCMQITGEIF